MKKISIIVLIILSYACPSFAKEFPIFLHPDTVLTQHSTFNRLTLLDMRQQKAYIGSLAAGVKKKPIVTSYPLDSMMRTFGATLIRRADKKEDNNLVMVLKDLVVEEKNNGEFTIGNIYLHADFYLEKNDRYAKAYHIDSLFEFRIAENSVEYLAKVANKIFGGLLSVIATNPLPQGQATYSLQEVQEMDQLDKSKYPVYTQAPRAGIYYTFEQFINNTPGDTAFIYRRNIGGDMVSDEFYRKEEGKKKGTDLADTACFAVYNGAKWFVPYGKKKNFKEMVFKNGDFFYTQRAEGLVLLSAGSFGYFGGGLIGFVVADAVAEGMNNNNPNRQGNAVFRYKLNPETGAGIKVERLE